jgi:hypothetical protein
MHVVSHLSQDRGGHYCRRFNNSSRVNKQLDWREGEKKKREREIRRKSIVYEREKKRERSNRQIHNK